MNQNLMKYYFVLFLLLTFSRTEAQFESPVFIQTSEDCAGIEQIVGADLNNDGYKDIIVAQSYAADRLSYYLHNGDNGFGERISLHEGIDNPLSLAVADFNNDSWNDIIAISNGSPNIYLYPNVFGTFPGPVLLDSLTNEPLQVYTDDLDNDYLVDAVICTTQEVFLYKNLGDYEYAVDTISSMSTIHSILLEDLNDDGAPDIIIGNDGIEILMNDGTGNFIVYDVFSEDIVGMYLYAYDADGDGDKDIVVYDGDLNLHLIQNNNFEEFFYDGQFAAVSAHVESLTSMDLNGDGILDLIAACYSKVFWYEGTEETILETENLIYENESYFITEVYSMDIDNNSQKDLVWSGLSQAIAYQMNLNPIGVQEIDAKSLNFYPNPAHHSVNIRSITGGTLTIKSLITGQHISTTIIRSGNTNLDLQHLVTGLYHIELIQPTGSIEFSDKLVLCN